MKRVARRLLMLIVAMVAAFAVTVAMAAWLAGGTGNGYAKADAAKALTTSPVSGSAITSGLLYPGGTGDVKLTINNPNPYPVEVTSIAQTPSSTITASGGSGTCTTTGVSFTDQTGNWVVPANGSQTVTLSGAAAMSNSSDDGCQGALFTIPVTLTGHSGS